MVEATASDAWEAALALGYGVRDGRTVPTLRRHRGPLRVQKHFEPEPGVCHHLIVHPPAGMAGGDYLTLTIDVATGAHAQLATPGATPWYRSRHALPARQHVAATLADGAVLELLPREHLIFDEARAELTTQLVLAPSAKLIAWEVVALGRPHGERPFVSGSLATRTEIRRDGELVFADRLRLDADDRMRASPLGLAGACVNATFVAVGEPLAPEVMTATRAIETSGRAGTTQLPHVFIGRWLGASVEGARQWLEALWTIVRPALLQRAAIPLRIWRT